MVHVGQADAGQPGAERTETLQLDFSEIEQTVGGNLGSWNKKTNSPT